MPPPDPPPFSICEPPPELFSAPEPPPAPPPEPESPDVPPLSVVTDPCEADELDDVDAEDELEEESPPELPEPHALSATTPATARDTKTEVFLAIIRLSFLPVIIDWFSTLSHTDGIFQEFSPPCGSFYAKSNK